MSQVIIFGKDGEGFFYPDGAEVRYRREKVRLSELQFKLFSLLIENHTRVVSQEELLNRGWGEGATVALNALSKEIGQIRNKLNDNDEEIIETIHSRGYRFVAPCKSVNDNNSTKQDYRFIINLKNIYHLTTKESQMRLAKGWISLYYSEIDQTITGEEETDVDEQNIGNRVFILRGFIYNHLLLYHGVSDFLSSAVYSARFLDIRTEYNIRKEITGTMICNKSFDFKEYIAPILLTQEQISDNEALEKLHDICHDFRLLGNISGEKFGGGWKPSK